MLNIIQNTIGAIRKVGESVVRAGLKMWLPFTKAESLGENLVVNGDFATDSDWTEGAGSGWTISNGKASNDGSVSGNDFLINSPYTSVLAKKYKVVFTVSDYVQGKVRVRAGQSSSTYVTDNGTYTQYQVSTNTETVRLQAADNFIGSIEKVSVEEYAQETPDISGNDNSAILKTGKALQFSGNDSVETSFPTSKDIKTIAFWIYPTHSSTGEGLLYFGGSYYGEQLLLLNHLTLKSANVNIDFDIYIDGVYRGVAIFGGDNPTLEINQWQRVVLKSSTAINTIGNTLTIAHGGTSSYGRFKMSDLQVYGAEWTTDDIAYDYANPQKLVTDNASSNVTLNDLHAWWHMSEGDGTIAFDSAPLLGVEEITNGNFESDSDWTVIDGGWTISNNEACHTGSASFIEQNTNLISGRTYKVVWTISSHTNQSAGISSNSGTRSGDISKSAEGTYVAYLVSNGNNFRFFSTGDNCIGSVSVKEVFNIDGETYDGSTLGATYVDAQERIPQLGMMNWSKGSNLFKYSEDLSQNYWSKTNATVTLNDAIAPDGTMSANKLSFAASSFPQVFTTAVTNLTVGQVYTASFYVKSDGTTQIEQSTLISGVTPITFTPTSNWQRVEVTFTATNTQHTFVVFTNSSNAPNSSFYIWGLQMEKNSFASTYRRTNGTAVTDATLISSATDSQKDILGNAVRIKGSGFNLDGTGYAEVLDDNVFDIGTGDFTVSAWAKYDFLYRNSNYNAIFCSTNGLADTFGISLASKDYGKFAARLGTLELTHDGVANIGDWHHIAIVRRSNVLYFYYDGVEQTNTLSDTANRVSTHSKWVGDDNNATYDRSYQNLIDDVMFYDEGLEADEVEQNYNATKSGHNN